jgi:hypothetical protein
MASIKPFHSTRCLDCRHVDESVRQAVSWMTRPRPGIRWESPVRAAKDRSGPNPISFQSHHSFLRRNP